VSGEQEAGTGNREQGMGNREWGMGRPAAQRSIAAWEGMPMACPYGPASPPAYLRIRYIVTTGSSWGE